MQYSGRTMTFREAFPISPILLLSGRQPGTQIVSTPIAERRRRRSSDPCSHPGSCMPYPRRFTDGASVHPPSISVSDSMAATVRSYPSHMDMDDRSPSTVRSLPVLVPILAPSVHISDAPNVSKRTTRLPVTSETDSTPSDIFAEAPNTTSSLFMYVHGSLDCLLKYLERQHPAFSGAYAGIRSCSIICARDLHPPAPLIIVSVIPNDSDAMTAPSNPSGSTFIVPPPTIRQGPVCSPRGYGPTRQHRLCRTSSNREEPI